MIKTLILALAIGASGARPLSEFASTPSTQKIGVAQKIEVAFKVGAHPTGAFTLDHSKGNATSLRECQQSLYSTPVEAGNDDFTFEMLNAMNGDRNSVTFQSKKNPDMYIVATTASINSTTTSLVLGPYNPANKDAVSFQVVGGLSSPVQFSFKTKNGQYIALTSTLEGDCASKYHAPSSSVTLVNFDDLKSKSDATWKLMIPAKNK